MKAHSRIRARIRQRRDPPSRAQTQALLRKAKDASDPEMMLVAADALEERGYLDEAEIVRRGAKDLAANKHTAWALRVLDDASVALGDPVAPFVVSKTYETWDEEAVEAGETDDRGFEYQNERMTLQETLRAIEDLGPDDLQGAVSLRWNDDRRQFMSLSGADSEQDFRTGDTTLYTLHIQASSRAMRRLRQWIRHALDSGYRRLTERRKASARDRLRARRQRR